MSGDDFRADKMRILETVDGSCKLSDVELLHRAGTLEGLHLAYMRLLEKSFDDAAQLVADLGHSTKEEFGL